MIIQFCAGDYTRYYWESTHGEHHWGECIHDDLMIVIEQEAEYDYSVYKVYVPKLYRYASVNLSNGQLKVFIE